MAEFRKAITRLMEARAERGAPAEDVAPAAAEAPAASASSPSRLPAGGESLAQDFREEWFGRQGVPDGFAHDAAELDALVDGAVRFLRSRGSRKFVVRAYTPSGEREGWSCPHVVVETLLDDRPFVVETVRETIQGLGGEVVLLTHPIVGVRRDRSGELEAVGPPGSLTASESFVHARVARVGSAAELEAALAERLADVVHATDDYAAMRARVAALASDLTVRPLPAPWEAEAAEAAAFLDWLGHKNFVYLGCREYQLGGPQGARRASVRSGSGLGILRDESRSRWRNGAALGEELWTLLNEPPLLLVTRSGAPSPVRRRVPMDCIAVKQVDAAGSVVGELRLLGLFTARAYREEASSVPVLRRKLAAVLAAAEVVEESHDYRELVALFNSLPLEELFGSTAQEIGEAIAAVRAEEGKLAVRVLCRPDTLRRGLLVTVILPRARFSVDLQHRVAGLLEQRWEARLLNQHLALDDRLQARLHFLVTVPAGVRARPDVAGLERDLNMLLRTWEDRFLHQLEREHAPAEASRLARKYAEALPLAYKAATDVADAVRDVHRLEMLAAGREAPIEIRDCPRAGKGTAALKMYLRGERLVLSDFIPVLDGLGLRVLDEDCIDLVLPGVDDVRIHTFLVQDARRDGLHPAERADALVEMLAALRAGRVESDPLNSLVLRAGLDWRAVDALRAYVEHARQIGVGAGKPILIEALTANPESARRLFEFFAARFDPAASPAPPQERAGGAAAAAREAFLAGLAAVSGLVHDRLLRALGAAVHATVRTNFFSPAGGGLEADAIAFKLDCGGLPHLPAPRPMFEIYVHSARLEGVHLRAGRAARGGIRLSDRPDDFRTEILGLMKTQVVKNAVIVPVGAKGGFVVKAGPGGALPGAAEIDLAYRTFIASLLRLTDNLEDGQVVPPPGLLIYDGPDPYLVVAADKGTARFSDTANEIAARFGFWLGDAFASGGSHGYDHKEVGITARGAWECVRHHFREMGRDADREPITVIGIGDMSGDVFGNGLLCSAHLRLLAAFDHRHVFLDPDPDPAASHRERLRLFGLPRSSWADYDPALVSAGGGVFPRGAKEVRLSPQARAMLGTDAESLSGEDLIRAVLRMEADLLWNGGIGTYVKASDESHADTGDHTNDRVRVDAAELRVKVVAEGGNLGFTQRARVEYALGGGRINTDAIDNSGGVDLSDHEVNLKIALRPLVLRGEMPEDERNRLLADLTEEVAAAVLAHNRRQALALGLDQARSRHRLFEFRDLMARLEVEGGLDRQIEHLPSREAMRARRAAYPGLTRPELAVLLAYSKLHLQRRVLESSLGDEPPMRRVFEAYFPPAIRGRLGGRLHEHRLRAEITAVETVNRLVDLMGMTFASRVATHTGCAPADAVAAWASALLVSGADLLLGEIEAACAVLSPGAEGRLHAGLAQPLEQATLWIAESEPHPVRPGEFASRFAGPVQLLLEAWPEMISGHPLERHRASVAALGEFGVEPALADKLARLDALPEALEIARTAQELDAPLTAVAEVHFELTEVLRVDWLRERIAAAAGEDRWEQRAARGLLDAVRATCRGTIHDVLTCEPPGSLVEDCLRTYFAAHRGGIEALRRLVDDLHGGPPPSLAAFVVAVHELARLSERR